MSDCKDVLIVGAGIAGCSAAITLARQGLNVTLVEKQSQWRFQSSGIFVYSNGLAALRDVGVLDGILAAGFAIDDGKNLYFDHLGTPIVDVHYPSVEAGIPPILGIKRAEMHRVLAGSLEELGVPIRLGTTVSTLITGSEQERASVTFSDGTHEQYDLIIAADGIRSQVRSLIYPSITPRKTGFGVWRSVHDRPASLDKKIMMMGIGKRLGIMPIANDKLYIFGTIAEADDAWYAPQDWPALMRSKFAEFGDPVRPFLDDVCADTEVLFTAVEEVGAPLPWHTGRVLLIGDAAHASTPFMGQGGAMAIEDAVVLSDVLKRHNNVFDALQAFGSLRFPVCKFVQDASRKVGEAGAVENPESCLQRNQTMKTSAQGHVDRFYSTLTAMKNAPTSA